MTHLFIKYIGYELEGGFSDRIGGSNEEDESEREYANQYFKEDGSVECENYIEGEIASPKFLATKSGLLDMDNFVKRNMPIEVNNTCGHHIHISFNNNLAYSLLMDVEFYNKFKDEVYNLFNHNEILCHSTSLVNRFNARFRGRDYCYARFSPNSQATDGYHVFDGNEHGRYTALNYSFREHGTIECRLFPASNKSEQVIKINNWFVQFVNNYLKNLKYERYNYDIMNVNYEDDKKTKEDKIILCV